MHSQGNIREGHIPARHRNYMDYCFSYTTELPEIQSGSADPTLNLTPLPLALYLDLDLDTEC